MWLNHPVLQCNFNKFFKLQFYIYIIFMSKYLNVGTLEQGGNKLGYYRKQRKDYLQCNPKYKVSNLSSV